MREFCRFPTSISTVQLKGNQKETAWRAPELIQKHPVETLGLVLEGFWMRLTHNYPACFCHLRWFWKDFGGGKPQPPTLTLPVVLPLAEDLCAQLALRLSKA